VYEPKIKIVAARAGKEASYCEASVTTSNISDRLKKHSRWFHENEEPNFPSLKKIDI